MALAADDHVERHLRHSYRGQKIGRDNDQHLHVSDLIDFCPRSFALCQINHVSYHPTENHGQAIGYTFQLGHKIQEITAHNLRTVGILYGTAQCGHCDNFFVGYINPDTRCPKCQSKAIAPADSRLVLNITDDLKVVGHVDLLPLLEPTVAIIGENKSIKSEEFNKMSEPIARHESQGSLYCWLVHRHATMVHRSPKDKVKILSDRYVLIYVTKGFNKEPFKVFERSPNRMLWTVTEAKIEELKRFMLLKKKTASSLPRKICDSQFNLMARDCVARTLCFVGKSKTSDRI